jgi:hypothetical protein
VDRDAFPQITLVPLAYHRLVYILGDVRKILEAEALAVHHLLGVLGCKVEVRRISALGLLDALTGNVALVPLMTARSGLSLFITFTLLLMLVGLSMRNQAVHRLLLDCPKVRLMFVGLLHLRGYSAHLG